MRGLTVATIECVPSGSGISQLVPFSTGLEAKTHKSKMHEKIWDIRDPYKKLYKKFTWYKKTKSACVWALAFVCSIFSTFGDPKATVLSTVALDGTCVQMFLWSTSSPIVFSACCRELKRNAFISHNTLAFSTLCVSLLPSLLSYQLAKILWMFSSCASLSCFLRSRTRVAKSYMWGVYVLRQHS